MNQTNIAYAQHLNTRDIWEVQCLRCSESLGTMTYATVLTAIEFNRNRGGVLCPECRAASCIRCGTKVLEKGEINSTYCPVCTLEVEADPGVTACLSTHNST